MAVATTYQNATRYRQTQTSTATNTQLVVMLYDGAIRFLSIAQSRMSKQDLEIRHRNLLNAQRIISQLMASLDFEQGGEVAANLQRIYIYMLRELWAANRHDKVEPITEVIAELRILRESWATLDEQQKLKMAAIGEFGA